MVDIKKEFSASSIGYEFAYVDSNGDAQQEISQGFSLSDLTSKTVQEVDDYEEAAVAFLDATTSGPAGCVIKLRRYYNYATNINVPGPNPWKSPGQS